MNRLLKSGHIPQLLHNLPITNGFSGQFHLIPRFVKSPKNFTHLRTKAGPVSCQTSVLFFCLRPSSAERRTRLWFVLYFLWSRQSTYICADRLSPSRCSVGGQTVHFYMLIKVVEGGGGHLISLLEVGRWSSPFSCDQPDMEWLKVQKILFTSADSAAVTLTAVKMTRKTRQRCQTVKLGSENSQPESSLLVYGLKVHNNIH